MSEINCGLHEARFGLRCEIYGCNNSADYVISNKDQIRGTSYSMCKDCLKELGVEISKVLGVKESPQIPLESNLTPSNLEDLKKDELLEICREKGIESSSSMKKEELIELIKMSK